MVQMPWKESATLLLIAKNQAGAVKSQFDYKVLMLKRSGKSAFMPNTFVFPGGKSDPSDFHPKWAQVIQGAGISTDHLLRAKSQRPLLMKVPQREGELAKDIAFRLCAIRETFEECGILDLIPPQRLDHDQLKFWRQRVYSKPSQFLDMCQEHGVCPNVGSLYETAEWLTPVGRKDLGQRRFDTMFYSQFLSAIPEGVSLDDQEVTELSWTEPGAILEDARQGKLELAPPQVYEFHWMNRFKRVRDLERQIRKMDLEGVSLTYPVLFKCQDCVLSVLPGDELYPAQPDLEGSTKSEKPVLNLTFDAANTRYPRANRMGLFDKYTIRPHVTIFDQ